MALIRFPDAATERKALGFLAGRYSFRTWANGDLLLPISALRALTREKIKFILIPGSSASLRLCGD
jgi:hypothetical protein